MKPVPILFLDHATALGGAELSLLTILRHLDRGRWEPHLAGPAGPLTAQARRAGVETHPIDFPRLRDRPPPVAGAAATARRLAGLARRIGAGLIYANTVRTAFYGAGAAAGSGRRLVWHMRDAWLSADRPRHPWLDSWLKRLLCAAATRVIANSRYTASRLGASGTPEEVHGTAPPGPSPARSSGKITVIHNGIEPDAFDPAPDGAAFRDRWGLDPGQPVAGTVGRLVPSKGQQRFVAAMGEVAAACPEARFLLVGGAIFGEDAAYEDSLRRLAVQCGLGERLTLTGHLSDVAPALAAMDVFVQPGDPEGFGRINLEAMAMARPVVALAHGSLPEIVVDGETGLLVPPGEPGALSRAVIDLLRSPERGRRMGAAGRGRLLAEFTAARMIERVERTLGEVVG